MTIARRGDFRSQLSWCDLNLSTKQPCFSTWLYLSCIFCEAFYVSCELRELNLILSGAPSFPRNTPHIKAMLESLEGTRGKTLKISLSGNQLDCAPHTPSPESCFFMQNLRQHRVLHMVEFKQECLYPNLCDFVVALFR